MSAPDPLLIPDGWKLVYSDLPGNRCGQVSWRENSITIDPRLPRPAQRCTLAHEIQHIHRGPCPPGHRSQEERAVEEAAARDLIGLHDLGEALAESTDLDYVAAVLDVDRPMLEARLGRLRPEEAAWLEDRLAE